MPVCSAEKCTRTGGKNHLFPAKEDSSGCFGDFAANHFHLLTIFRKHHSYLTSQLASPLLRMGEKPHSHPLPHLGTSPGSSSAPRTHVAPRYHPGHAPGSAPAVAGSRLIQTGTFLTLALDFPGRQGDEGSQERKVSKYKTQSVLSLAKVSK